LWFWTFGVHYIEFLEKLLKNHSPVVSYFRGVVFGRAAAHRLFLKGRAAAHRPTSPLFAGFYLPAKGGRGGLKKALPTIQTMCQGGAGLCGLSATRDKPVGELAHLPLLKFSLSPEEN
jgi:hypothetical protein